MHVQPLFGDGDHARTTRRRADRAVETNPLGLERCASFLETTDLPHLVDAVNSPCYDARGEQDETEEHAGDEGPAAQAYSALRHARSRALRARGF